MLCACGKSSVQVCVYSKEGITSLTLWMLLYSGLNYLSLLYKLKEIQGSNLHRVISSNLFWQPEIAGIQSLCSLPLLNHPYCTEYSTEQGLVLLFREFSSLNPMESAKSTFCLFFVISALRQMNQGEADSIWSTVSWNSPQSLFFKQMAPRYILLADSTAP